MKEEQKKEETEGKTLRESQVPPESSKHLALLNGKLTHARKVNGTWLVGGDKVGPNDTVSITANKFDTGVPSWHQLKGNRLIFEDSLTQEELKQHYALREGSLRESLVPEYSDPSRGDPFVEEADNGTLKGTNFAPKDNPAVHQRVIDSVTKALRAIVGEPSINFKNTMRFKPFEASKAHSLYGAQLHNAIYIAYAQHSLGARSGPKGVLMTALHEGWHYLYDFRTGLFSSNERRIMDSSLPQLAKNLMEHHDLSKSDVTSWLNSPTGRQEIAAEAFSRWAVDKANTKVPLGVKGLFIKGVNFLKGLHNGLKGEGYGTYEDVFKRTLEGDKNPSTYNFDANSTRRVVRLSKVSEELSEAQRQDLASMSHLLEPFQDRIVERNKEPLGLFPTAYARSISTMTGIAHMNPEIGGIQALGLHQQQLKSGVFHDLIKIGADFYRDVKGVTTSPEDRIKAMKILDHLRSTDQPIKLNDKGLLEYTKDDKVPEVNQKLTKMVVGLDRKNKSILDHYEKTFRKSVKDLIPDSESISKENLKKYIDTNEASLKKSGDFERLNDLHDGLKGLERLRHFGYISHSRFGPFGLTVHRTSSYIDNPNGTHLPKVLKGDAIPLFHTQFDEGRKVGGILGTNQADAKQVQASMEELKSLGLLDRPDVIISPVYQMTHDLISQRIPSNMRTLDMLGDLLANIKDPKEFAAQMEKFEGKINVKGFMKRLTESNNVPGYSKDWMRVDSAFNGGQSSHVARMQTRPIMDAYEDIINRHLSNSISGQSWRLHQAQKYLAYLKRPQDELRKTAVFQAMWALGGNVSSALMQFVGLPQFTLGHMTQFNPNVFENTSRLSSSLRKVMGIFMEKDGISMNSSGVFNAHFDNPDIVKALGGSEASQKFIAEMSRNGTLGAARKEEQFSQMSGEQRSEMTPRMNLWNAVKNYSMLPMTASESMVRAATAHAYYNLFEERPEVLSRAVRLLKDDEQFKAMRTLKPEEPLINLVVEHSIHETQGIFGRLGRGPMYRDEGKLIFPFMQYTMSMNEMMARMWSRGPEGKKAFGVTLGMTMMLAGALGLPGAELIKGAVEQLYKAVSLQSVDVEQATRTALFELTGSPTTGLFLTHGLPRTLGLDLGSRLNDQIAGQDGLLTMMGAKKPGGSDLGVPGGIFENAFKAFDTWRFGGTSTQTLSLLSPTAISNLFKALEYEDQGAHTFQGTQLLTPEYMQSHPQDAALRVLGIGTGDIASEAEQHFWKSSVNMSQQPFIDASRAEGARIMTRIMRGDPKASEDFSQFVQEVSEHMADKMMPSGVFRALMQDIENEAVQRSQGGVPLKEYKKNTVQMAQSIKGASGSKQ